jgi:transposase
MKRNRYTKAFKRQLVALVAQGRTPEQLSREYEPTSQTIRTWVREAQKQQPASELEKDRQIRDLKA